MSTIGSMSCRSSVIDFERTSTVRAPTVVAPEDYTSTVNVDDLRKQYFSDYRTNKELPIYANRANLIRSINSYSVVIVEGATGCGKTTQVPTYILEDAILERKVARSPVIYVTQPRRIAARSIATRVCTEHGWTLGSIVGYQVSLDKAMGPDTVLVFCTAGILLQKIIHERSLINYTHIIIDEAHERDADTDLLLMMIKKLLCEEKSMCRLIVMSATMDITKLKNFFTFRTNYGHRGLTTPSICKIGQQTKPSTIQIIYCDKLKSTFQLDVALPVFDELKPEIHDECLVAAVKIILEVIPHLDTYSEATKSTLVFLPGLAEIQKLHRLLKIRGADDYIDIIPLHSCLPNDDQARVFFPCKAGYRKVILATNIAESSITVRDVGFIIDFCLTKVLRKDSITKFPTLKLQWCTRDKGTQRSGRTGRCCQGKAFRMVPQAFYEQFGEYAEPELLTAPLELSVLKVKNFQMGAVSELFSAVLDPPPTEEVRGAVLELKQIGALSSTYNGKISDVEGDLTELGKVIVHLPIDVHLSKLIVLASVFDILEPAIVISACLSTNRTVVKHLYADPLKSYDLKLKWANGTFSDLMLSLDVFMQYIDFKIVKGKSQHFMEHYCHSHYLDEKKLHEVSALVEEIRLRLLHLNIQSFEQPNRIRDRFEDELMLKIAFCASFYPNYFLSQELDVADVKRALCGMDPTKTVILHSFPNFPCHTPLYMSQVLNQLEDAGVCTSSIDYYEDSSRAMLVVNDDDRMEEDECVVKTIGNDGVVRDSKRVERTVYKLLKMGDLMESTHKLMIREYQETAARDRMRYYDDKKQETETGGRFKPSLTKIVSGRPADNSRLATAPDEEFYDINYVEVEFNEAQDTEDLALELDRLELGGDTVEVRIDEHPVFKSSLRLLRGPTSPAQVIFRSVLEKSKDINVDIDFLSVNSVLIDADYEKASRQMLVAASVGQSSKSGRIVARDTTLMPNIRGLPTLMALLFAQYYRVIYNEQLKCLTGAIFGIGWDEKDESIDKTYEVELSFDVHITQDDIELINKARRITSDLIKGTEVQNPGAPRFEAQQRLRQIILALIKKRRYPLTEAPLLCIDWTEGNFVKDKHNVPRVQLERLESNQARVFLPVMEANKKYSEMDFYSAMRANLNQWKLIEQRIEKPPIGGIRCLLCGSGLEHLYLMQRDIVKHLGSECHQAKLRDFEAFESRAKRRQLSELMTMAPKASLRAIQNRQASQAAMQNGA